MQQIRTTIKDDITSRLATVMFSEKLYIFWCGILSGIYIHIFIYTYIVYLIIYILGGILSGIYIHIFIYMYIVYLIIYILGWDIIRNSLEASRSRLTDTSFYLLNHLDTGGFNNG